MAAAARRRAADPIAFWELASHDEAKSARFFRKVFNWAAKFDRGLGFHRVTAPGGPGAANGYIFTLRQARLPFLTIYIRVKDIRAKRDLVVKHGGSIVEEPNEIVPGSTICLFNEPSGVTYAMIEARD